MADQDPEIVTGPRDQAGEFIQRPAKLLRIASMIRELLEDVRQSAPDEAGLQTLTMPLDHAPSESEIRIAQAQLEEMRRRGLPPGAPEGERRPGQYL